MSACISEPISWLRLERHALAADAEVAAHVASCAACRSCLDEIERDVVALPALVVPERKRTRWWVFAIPALAAAAVVLFLLRPRDELADDVARVKGVGDVVLDVLRERAGGVREDVRTYASGDRWKVIVTCPPDKGAWLDVAVTDDGGTDFPLAPAHVACGNRVVVPGAFSITGSRPNRVCVRVAADAAPPRRAPRGREPDVACVTLTPE
jgi:hypothetical protein